MTASAEFAGFRPKALAFFRALARHNEKPWFEEHRAEYEAEVRAPLAALVEEVDARLGTLAPEIVGDQRRSLFRIHRDVRFSRDKRPYKTHAACWFFHRDAGHGVGGEAAHGGAGFYFHLAPEGSFCGGGMWMPPRPTLQKLRDALLEDHRPFERAVLAKPFVARFGALDDEAMLKRLPRGVAAGHPAERWLRHQSFTAGRKLTRDEVASPGLPDVLARDFALLLPLVRWLNGAIGLRAHARR